MTRGHGVVRELENVSKSSLEGARFGRMFRWLPGETYRETDLNQLAMVIIQRETADFRTRGDTSTPPTDRVVAGPDVVFKTIPMPAPNAGKLLDTAFGVPEPADENPTIPAGYTYFGQFIDHDLTFDPNSSLQKQNDPNATVDFRTPRLDLNSLYGRGPDDQPYLYKNAEEDGGGNRFLLGRAINSPLKERFGELPRNVEGRSLTGDPRNDENRIVSQLQALFLNFHNKVVDSLQKIHPSMSNHDLFAHTQRIVRWHYQYLVLNDYLPRVVGQATWQSVFQGHGEHHPEQRLRIYRPKHGKAYMPVEFSVAAFQFGHSMVRPSYALRSGEACVGGDPRHPSRATTGFTGYQSSRTVEAGTALLELPSVSAAPRTFPEAGRSTGTCSSALVTCQLKSVLSALTRVLDRSYLRGQDISPSLATGSTPGSLIRWRCYRRTSPEAAICRTVYPRWLSAICAGAVPSNYRQARASPGRLDFPADRERIVGQLHWRKWCHRIQ